MLWGSLSAGKSYGGAFCFADGIVEQKAAYGVETILFVEV